MERKKVIVFGGSGFLGSHVSDELTKNDYDVFIFDIKKSPYFQTNQTMIIGNILDKDLVRETIKGAFAVFHFAAIADIEETRNKPLETVNYNVIGTINILEACREFNVERFVYASTIYVYSDHGSFYRSSKQSCELFIENYQKEFNLNFTILRYGSLYGTRANDFNFIRNSIRQALLEGVITRNGDGKEVRDYINIVDAAKASVNALDQEYKNSYLMITGSQKMKVREVLLMIREILDDQVQINYVNKSFEGHYKITPYSFKPKVAIKITPKDYHDLGQGILDSIYEIYQELVNEGLNPQKIFRKK
tara:strand:- start:474 stop:1391 length:918 start_codon:yes stop_codon:yes gene_type:complete